MNVVAHGSQISIPASVHDQGFVSATEEMTTHFVTVIEPGGTSAHEPAHPDDEVCVRRFNNEMKMIVHETIGMNLPVGLGTNLAESDQKTLPINVVAEDRLATVTSIEEVINGARVFYPQCAGHACFYRHRIIVSIVGTDPGWEKTWRQLIVDLLKADLSDDQKRFCQQKSPGARA